MGTPKQPSLAPAHALGVRKSDPGIRSLGNDAGGRRRRPAAQSMFQIPEFEPSEQEDSNTAERGLGPSLTGDQPGPCLAPGLLGSIRHQQEQAANSSHHGGTGAMEIRSRHSSYTAGNEEDDGMEEELSPFRGRSRSAPPNLWAAQRYGRELRRMSDEFEGSFKVSACVGDFLAQRAQELQHRCDKAPAGRALSSPGGIETWAKEAPPPLSDLLLHIPGTLPAPVARHIGCGRKFSEAVGIKRGSLCPFNWENWPTARLPSGACNSHEGVVLVGSLKVSASPTPTSGSGNFSLSPVPGWRLRYPNFRKRQLFPLSRTGLPSCAKLRAGLHRDLAAALLCELGARGRNKRAL